MTCNVRYLELGKFAVPGMRVKVRWFPHGANDEHVWCASSNILSFSRVVGAPVLTRNVSKDSPSFRPAGPLTFRPRSAVWESRRNGSQVLTVSSYFDADFTAARFNQEPEGMPIDDFSMVELMQILHDEIRMPGSGTHDIVSAIGKILRIKLSRLLTQQAVKPAIGKPCRSVDAAIIHGLISRASGRSPTTAELAEEFNTSRRSLLRLFKATTGTAPSRYIDETKLDSAKTLLATSNMSMKQIAYEVGYSTASHFSTKFRRLTGLTPSAFRRRARRQDDLRSEYS